jgi:hypothetical protein
MGAPPVSRRLRAIGRFLRRFARYYPLTGAGTVLAAAAFYLAGRGLAQANPYAVFLALLAAVVLGLLVLAGRLQAAALARRQFHWDCSAPLAARRPGTEQSIHGPDVRLLPFYRLQFRFAGRLDVGRGAGLRVVRQVSFSASGVHPLPLNLPLCGELSARGRFCVRDVFGLTRARFGEEPERTLTVLPAWLAPDVPPLVEPAGGFEEKSQRRSSEEEKYFMREYQPGDRFRDINWKVSSRLQELITRISPVTQEKTRLLSVELRNYRSGARETLESVLHLDYLKSWLLAFLRGLKKANERLQFRVRSGAGSELLATEEDIERFAGVLATLHFQSDPGAGAEEPPAGELFIFSTPFDRALGAYLAARPLAQAHVFRTVHARARPAPAAALPVEQAQADAAHAGGNGQRPPGRTAAGKAAGGTPLARTLFPPGGDLSDAFLPGAWIFRRERGPAVPALPQAAGLEEAALYVGVLP